MLFADIVLLFLIAVTLTLCVLARSPKPFRDPPRPVLICAAHSDDCVIIGAEYASGAVERGLPVKVAYLTCSGPHPDAEISRRRKAEALTAWSSLGVPIENLIFANLPESPVEGPSNYSPHDLGSASAAFEAAILSL